jgi:hypothetical protein
VLCQNQLLRQEVVYHELSGYDAFSCLFIFQAVGYGSFNLITGGLKGSQSDISFSTNSFLWYMT